jgi:cytoskeletal protein CcmA (bactofilin family)
MARGDAAEIEAAESSAEPVPFEPRREEKRLIVGQGIVLKGEVSACDRLVVEGRVEVSLNDSDVIVIAEGGEYRGNAHINEADISGKFEGSLTVRKRLIVRATGQVNGEIRYGELEVERGGRMSGDLQFLDEVDSGGEVKASQGD